MTIWATRIDFPVPSKPVRMSRSVRAFEQVGDEPVVFELLAKQLVEAHGEVGGGGVGGGVDGGQVVVGAADGGFEEFGVFEVGGFGGGFDEALASVGDLPGGVQVADAVEVEADGVVLAAAHHVDDGLGDGAGLEVVDGFLGGAAGDGGVVAGFAGLVAGEEGAVDHLVHRDGEHPGVEGGDVADEVGLGEGGGEDGGLGGGVGEGHAVLHFARRRQTRRMIEKFASMRASR
ncbi:hypothetical protein QYN14_25275 [Rhodococcus ruber]|nr:hypothetical protein [Rhodococcus ruber]WKK11943.1 hypothetical protein QYN14_25275 [Rhodococcus ruber]